MILVTGGSGFIGSHLIRRLVAMGEAVCNVDPRTPSRSLALKEALELPLTAIFHLGAISDTTCVDGEALQEANIDFPFGLARFCKDKEIPLIYASSASVYGNGGGPLNAYAESKDTFDAMMQEMHFEWYGLRFFNVYGSGEDHKDRQASMVHQLANGLDEVFCQHAQRDFVHVDDVVDVMIWVWKSRPASGIYDVGTGVAVPFTHLLYLMKREIPDGPLPESLRGKYQFHTKADLTKLRAAGYDRPFLSLEEGISRMRAQ